ncbi:MULTISPECIES: hypothetical protein [unclassified Bradyrhizobium]|nr:MULTISPECIES: hypothetical protein [unclassified Bradyrhizobium]
MRFDLRDNGGNLAGCEWIAAEGVITDTTADNLRAFLDSFGHTHNPGRPAIRFHSPGGSLSGGIKLGELVRQLKFDTEVGQSQPDEYGHWRRAPGFCASACSFAFLGGLHRSVSAGEFGVHQFYNELSLRDPFAKLFSALDVSHHQLVSAMLIDYVYRMGVDPRLVSLASSVLPEQMHFLAEEELNDLKVRWHPKEFQPWSIVPMGGGIAAATHSRDRTRFAHFLYREDGVPTLLITNTEPHLTQERLDTAVKDIASVEAFGLVFPSSALNVRFKDNVLALEYSLKGVDSLIVETSRQRLVGVDGPRYILNTFSYLMPEQNAKIAIDLAAKNPV